jgi:hypothetical protein
MLKSILTNKYVRLLSPDQDNAWAYAADGMTAALRYILNRRVRNMHRVAARAFIKSTYTTTGMCCYLSDQQQSNA